MNKILQNPFFFEEGEILNFDKPLNMTSFKLVSHVRRLTKCRKVGHAGTLDPLATGVLLVCTGKFTKRIHELMNLEKVYVGEIELGKQTETDDAEGNIIATNPVPKFEYETIETILDQFIGDIQQIPPVFSAIRIHGKRAYKLARQGKVVDLPPRIVTIHEIELCRWEHPLLKIRVRCAKGTYIRSLARDIGSHLKTGGYLKSLRRISVGPYHVENALQLDTFRKMMVDYADISVA